MKHEDIIALAMEAGFATKLGAVWVDHWEITRTVERFAALVAAAEREACAKLCDGWLHADGDQCAAAIRARSQE